MSLSTGRRRLNQAQEIPIDDEALAMRAAGVVNRTSRAGAALYYCFTYNNPEHSAKELIDLLEPITKYIIFQREVGESGTEHYQGYLELTKAMRYTTICNRYVQMHFERRKGTADEARNYCLWEYYPEDYRKEDFRGRRKRKEGPDCGPWEAGDFAPVSRGQRTDLKKLYELAKSSMTHAAIAEALPIEYMKFFKSVDRIRVINGLDLIEPMRHELRVILFYGKSGTGKTTAASEYDSGRYKMPPIQDKIWLPNYNAQKTVLLDEFKGQMKLDYLLQFLDIHELTVENKGGHVYFQPTTIVITTTEHPDTWYNYQGRPEMKIALQRRITEIRHFDDPTRKGTYKFTTWGNSATWGEEPREWPQGTMVPRWVAENKYVKARVRPYEHQEGDVLVDN